MIAITITTRAKLRPVPPVSAISLIIFSGGRVPPPACPLHAPPTLIRVYHSYQSASYLSASHGMARPGPAAQSAIISISLSVRHRVGTYHMYLFIHPHYIPKLYISLQFTFVFIVAEIPIYLIRNALYDRNFSAATQRQQNGKSSDTSTFFALVLRYLISDLAPKNFALLLCDASQRASRA